MCAFVPQEIELDWLEDPWWLDRYQIQSVGPEVAVAASRGEHQIGFQENERDHVELGNLNGHMSVHTVFFQLTADGSQIASGEVGR